MKQRLDRVLTPFREFVRSESIGGILLVVTAVFAFAWANSGWAEAYEHMKHVYAGFSVGGFTLKLSLLHWVNDGLMAVFFLLVGLEIKRELLVGELSDRKAAALPVAAAIGGMVIPALLYVGITRGTPAAGGWGIPMATDIAFALGVMALLGSRVPLALKVFVTALAIVDDLGAIAVIALFYTESIDVAKLGIALVFWGLAFGYGRSGGRNLMVFGAIGIAMWYLTFQSGIHATVAGVLLALAIPMSRQVEPAQLRSELDGLVSGGDFEEKEVKAEHLEELLGDAQSPLHRLEHKLHPVVAYAIMPIFALFNAGFAISGDVSLMAGAALGSFVGLLAGKPLGVFAASWIAVRTGVATLPRGVTWPAIAGAGILAGIGFTMALFIAGLAFPDPVQLDQAKLGVMSASVLAAALGAATLLSVRRPEPAT